MVTTPTVSAPARRAISATTGAAPVPVPPPIPQVTKTMSEPSSSSATCDWLSLTALRPTSGRPPEPIPPVVSGPMANVCAFFSRLSAWTSVLSASILTPRTPASIMRPTALPPAPPVPTTATLT